MKKHMNRLVSYKKKVEDNFYVWCLGDDEISEIEVEEKENTNPPSDPNRPSLKVIYFKQEEKHLILIIHSLDGT